MLVGAYMAPPWAAVHLAVPDRRLLGGACQLLAFHTSQATTINLMRSVFLFVQAFCCCRVLGAGRRMYVCCSGARRLPRRCSLCVRAEHEGPPRPVPV